MNHCSKVYFSDERFAQEYINKLQRTSNRRIKPVRAYLCEKCLNWHLTSIEGNEARDKANNDRQINNLKSKIIHLEAEVKRLNLKLEKCQTR